MRNFTINALSSQGSQRSLDTAGRVLENSELHCSALLTSCSRLLKLTLVVTKLDRLGRSVTDLHAIASELEAKGARLAYGGSTHDPADPAGKLFFTMLGAMAEFEADLIRARTREGVAIAKAEGRMLGRTPKLSALQRRRLLADYETGEYSTAQLMEISGLSRSAMYATLARAREEQA